MNPEVLSQLKGADWPVEPSWWPLSVGYYLVVAVILGLAVAGFFYGRRWVTRRHLRRQLLGELSLIENRFLQNQNIGLLQSEISMLVAKTLRHIVSPRGLTAGSVKLKVGYGYRAQAAVRHEGCPLKSMDAVFTLAARKKEFDEIFPRQEPLFFLLLQDRYHREPQIDANKLLMLAKFGIQKCRL